MKMVLKSNGSLSSSRDTKLTFEDGSEVPLSVLRATAVIDWEKGCPPLITLECIAGVALDVATEVDLIITDPKTGKRYRITDWKMHPEPDAPQT